MVIITMMLATYYHRPDHPIPVTQPGRQFGIESPWTTKVHSQVCLHPERHTSCTGSVSSSGFWWRWCQAPDVPTETGAHRPRCPSGRRLWPRQTCYGGWSWWDTTNLGYSLSFGFLKKKKRVTHLDCSETFGVTRTTKLRVVPWCLKLLATTTAPMQ